MNARGAGIALRVLVLASVLLCSSCDASKAQPTFQEAPVSLVPVQHVVLLSVHMVTPQAGWGMSLHSILHTADGAHHWTVSRRLTGGGAYLSADLLALDSRHVRVVASTHVFSTDTSGRRWRVSGPLIGYLPQGAGITFGSPDMSFVDPRHGWILTTGGPAAGRAEYSVYRTEDGGLTWARIAYNSLLPNHPFRGRLPSCDCLGGISFRNRQVGWMTGTPFAIDTELIFYRTSDGGVIWNPRPLPLPHGFQQYDVSTAPPAFFGRAGVLPVAFVRPAAFVLYVSHNGGTTWHATSPIRERAAQPGASADAFALDPMHVWVWIGQTLYETSDGGKHWHPLARNLPARFPELQFLSPRIGYVLNEYPAGGKDRPYLLETTNGGKTWHKIAPLLSR